MNLIADKYRVEYLLSEGKGGSVYITRPNGLFQGPPCVLKTLAIQSDEHKRQFEKEMPLLVELSHTQEHIARVHEDYGIDEKKGLYSVMEVLQGESLEQLLKRETHLPLLPTLRLFQQLCEAMSAAHEVGLVHRHLSPARLMLVQQFMQTEPILKVVDFGVMLPPLLLLPTDPVFLEELKAWGDPLYLAPELWHGESATASTDQYAMGCILFEMLTGEAPFFFQNDDLLTLSIAHRARTPEALKNFKNCEHYPDKLNDILQKVLAKEPHERFSTVHDLRTAISVLIEELEELPTLDIPELNAADSEDLLTALGEELPPLESSKTAWLVKLVRDPLEPDEDFFTSLAVDEVSSVMVVEETAAGGTMTSIHELPTTQVNSELVLDIDSHGPVKHTQAYGVVGGFEDEVDLEEDDQNLTREWGRANLIDLEALLPTESGSEFDAIEVEDGDATILEMVITSPIGIPSPFEESSVSLEEPAPADTPAPEVEMESETPTRTRSKTQLIVGGLLLTLILIVGVVFVVVLMNAQ